MQKGDHSVLLPNHALLVLMAIWKRCTVNKPHTKEKEKEEKGEEEEEDEEEEEEEEEED